MMLRGGYKMKLSKRIAAVLAAAVMSCTAVAPISASAAKTSPTKTSSSAKTGKTGFSKKNGKYYYYKNGTMVKSSFVKHNDKYYYFLTDGQMATSWVKLDGTYYRFGTDGIMYTGWKKIDNKWYYFGNDGKMRTGTVTIGGKSYKFSSAGVWDGKAGTAVTTTAATTAKKSVDYTCTKEDIIAIKGLKEGQYTYVSSKNLLYYRCKFLNKDAIAYYYFDNGKLAFYATGILNFNLTENDMQSAYKALADTYNKSLGKSVMTYDEIQGEVWQSGKNFVIVAYTNGVVMSMNVSADYMQALNSGKATLPDFSDR